LLPPPIPRRRPLHPLPYLGGASASGGRREHEDREKRRKMEIVWPTGAARISNIGRSIAKRLPEDV